MAVLQVEVVVRAVHVARDHGRELASVLKQVGNGHAYFSCSFILTYCLVYCHILLRETLEGSLKQL